MFGNKKMEETKNNGSKKGILPVGSAGAINSLVHDTQVEGDIKSGSDIRIDGKLIGKLECKAKVIIGQSGSVDGEISCKNAVIEGAFSGTLKVHEILDIRSSAKIDGEISTNKLIVESGAVFNVKCNMGVLAKGKTGVKPEGVLAKN